MLMGLPAADRRRRRSSSRTIQANGRHLLSIINDLLDVAKIESGEVELELVPVDCREVMLEEVVSGLRPLARGEGHRLRDGRAGRGGHRPYRPPLAESDPHQPDEQRHQVHGRRAASGRARQRAQGRRGRRHVFSVSTPAWASSRKTERSCSPPFEQSSSPRHAATKEPALASTSARSLATLIDGDITFESEYGEGTTSCSSCRRRLRWATPSSSSRTTGTTWS